MKTYLLIFLSLYLQAGHVAADDGKDCSEDMVAAGKAIDLAINVLKATRDAHFIKTATGHKIHESCLEPANKKQWFLDNAKKSVTDGLACLERLGRAGGRGAAKNYVDLKNLMKGKEVELKCDDKDYEWGEHVQANGTAKENESTKNISVVHPGVSIGPGPLKKNQSRGEAGKLDFRRTLFHEQLHNLGYLHDENLEFSYTCETCCFPLSTESTALTNIACKVCSGNYSGINDPNYLKDFSLFSIISIDNKKALATSTSYLRNNPGDLNGLSYLSSNLAGIYNPVGPHLAALVKAGRTLTSEQDGILDYALKNKNDPSFTKYESSAKTLAQAYFDSYKGDPATAIKLLERESDAIRAQLNLVDADTKDLLVKDDLKASLGKLLSDVFEKKYFGSLSDPKKKKDLDDLAVNLYKKFGFIK